MPEDLFSDPQINDQIQAGILRLQAASLEWDDNPGERGYEDHIVETLVESLNLHADGYLHKVGRRDLISKFIDYLRSVGAALIRNAERRSILSDPYSEDRLRQMAENTGEFLSRRHLLTPEQKETEIHDAIERLQAEFQEKAAKWHQWRDSLLLRIESRFEARYRYWGAEAIERVQRRAFELEAADRDPIPKAPSNVVSSGPIQITTAGSAEPGSGPEPEPAVREIEVALQEGRRKQAVQMRRKLDQSTTTALWTDAFKSRKGTDKTKRTAFDRWQAKREDTPSWADELMRAHLLR